MKLSITFEGKGEMLRWAKALVEADLLSGPNQVVPSIIPPEGVPTYPQNKATDHDLTPLEELQLPVRVLYILKLKGVLTVGDIIRARGNSNIGRFPGMGKRSILLVDEQLSLFLSKYDREVLDKLPAIADTSVVS